MPNDNAGGWPDPTRMGVPMLPEVDAFHWLLKRNGAWPEAWLWHSDADGCGTEHSGAWAESDGDGQPDTMARWYSYLGPCLTPSEVTARERAAYAAGAEAMREECAEVVMVWPVAPEACLAPSEIADRDAVISYGISALPIPDDASAALAEVVRRAVEPLEAALKDALELLDVCWGHDPGANLQYRWGPHPYKHAQKVRDAARAAIRARSTEGSP